MATSFAKSSAFLAAACIVAGLTGPREASAQPAEPAVYGSLPLVSEFQLSPDGRRAAAIQELSEGPGIVFYDLDNPGAVPSGLALGDVKARDLVWADNDRVLALVSATDRVDTDKGL